MTVEAPNARAKRENPTKSRRQPAYRGDRSGRSSLDDVGAICEATTMKGQQKPKQLAKKAPQKTLKEQRAAKKAKKKEY
jgi:hypothetical protein